MNFVKEWFETHRGLFRSDVGVARRERRDVRNISRDLKKEHQVLTRIDAAFSSGLHENIVAAFRLYFNAMEKELHDLMSLVYDYKTLMRRALDELRDLAVAIQQNPNEPEKDTLVKNVRAMHSRLKDNYDGFFRSLTGFENRNLSAAQLLDEASLVRDAFYQTAQLRKSVRVFSRQYREILGQQRAGKQVDPKHRERVWRIMHEGFKSELSWHKQELVDIFQLLNDFEKHLDKLHEKVQELRNADNYPEGWMNENYETLDKLREDLKGFIHRETEQARLFMSQEEHKAA